MLIQRDDVVRRYGLVLRLNGDFKGQCAVFGSNETADAVDFRHGENGRGDVYIAIFRLELHKMRNAVQFAVSLQIHERTHDGGFVQSGLIGSDPDAELVSHCRDCGDRDVNREVLILVADHQRRIEPDASRILNVSPRSSADPDARFKNQSLVLRAF